MSNSKTVIKRGRGKKKDESFLNERTGRVKKRKRERGDEWFC